MIFEKIEDKFIQWNQRFKEALIKRCPPGYEWKGEYRAFWGWLIASTLYSFQFVAAYSDSYNRLFQWIEGDKFLNPQMRMPLFETLFAGSMDGFVLGILFLAMVAGKHYSYYRKESKSIYFMKRIADRRVLWKTYFTTPIIYGCIFALTAVFWSLIYYGIYYWMTPAECRIL